jgi:GNAT superfamily N-acetyltransferase
MIKYVIVAYNGDEAVGCGSIKAFDSTSMEVKRMYTRPEVRGKGVASMILKELEDWILELGLERSVLETGKEFTEAVHLYTKWGYQRIPNYGQYIGIASSVCFEKML